MPTTSTEQSLASHDHHAAGIRAFGVFVLLFLSQRIPNSFFEIAIPAILRESGASLEQIGLLRLLAVVYLAKVLLAPYIDHYGSKRWGHYKSWIIPLQVLIFGVTLSFVFIDLVDDFVLFIAVAFVWLFLFALQDVAVDGMTIKTFAIKQYPAINAMQTMVATVGGLMGGLVVLLTSVYGFNAGVFLVACSVLIPLLVLSFFREHLVTTQRAKPSPLTILTTLKIPGVSQWIGLLVLLSAGPALSAGMISPMLIDQGFDLAAIGQLFGISYPITGLISVLFTPLLIRWIGSSKTVILATFCLIIDAVILLTINALEPGKWVIFGLLNFSAFTNVILLISIYSVTMTFCRKSHAGTDWTVIIAVFGATGSLFAAIGGLIAGQFGYPVLFGCSLVIAITTLIVIGRLNIFQLLSGTTNDGTGEEQPALAQNS